MPSFEEEYDSAGSCRHFMALDDEDLLLPQVDFDVTLLHAEIKHIVGRVC